MQSVFSIERGCDPHQENRQAVLAEGPDQGGRIIDYQVRGMGSRLPPDNAFLQIDNHQRGLCPINGEIAHSPEILL
jgi:hypothetical protein